jgi:chromosome partitioning protein
VTNQKGGVGKTTTSISLAVQAAKTLTSAMIIDLDPNYHATTMMKADDEASEKFGNAYDMLSGKSKPEKCVADSRLMHLKIIRGCDEMYLFERKIKKSAKRYKILSKCLSRINDVRDDIEFVIIDCPAASGLLQFNALAAADLIIVPMPPDYLALKGFYKLLANIKEVYNAVKRKPFYKVIFTMSRDELETQRDILKKVQSRLGDIVFPFRIDFDACFLSAASTRSSILDMYPDSKGSQQYIKLFNEVKKIYKQRD